MFSFFDDKPAAKSAPSAPKRATGHVPIHLLNSQGCKACPSNTTAAMRELDHPKMEPMGKIGARVYVLLSTPSSDEDHDGKYTYDRAGDAIMAALREVGYDRKVRINATVNCHQPGKEWQKPRVEATECCRGRVVGDIEATQPSVIIGVGDAAFRWATGIRDQTALTHRGTPFAVRIGNHTCWYLPVLYPNFAYNDKKYGKSEYELALSFDIAKAVSLIDAEAPVVYTGDYDRGVDIITGKGAGDMQRLEEALHRLLRNPRNAIDYETNGLQPRRIRNPLLITAALGTFEDTVAFPVQHPDGWGTDRRMDTVVGMLGDFILQSNLKVAHHLAMEQEWTEWLYGDYPLRLTEWGDTMAACHTLDERGGTKALETQTIMRFGFNLKALTNIDKKRMLDYPIAQVLRYNGMDTKWTDKLFTHLMPMVRARKADVWEYNRKVRLAPTLILTQRKGMDVDLDYAAKMGKQLDDEIAALDARIRKCPEVRTYTDRYGTFNPDAPDQVLVLLRDVCKCKEVRIADKKTGTRESSNEEVLTAVKDKVPSAAIILRHRQYQRNRNTYVDPILTGKYARNDGRLSCTYGSMVAETGRLNAEDPNLQNWPKHKHREVRGIIYARNGQWISANDYGQIEARVFGMASEDDNLMRYLWTGYDIHGFWADHFIKAQPDWLDWLSEEYEIDRGDTKALRKEGRQVCKNGWVFPQFFGSATRNCAANMHLDEDVAEDAAQQFWDEFKGVKRWQDKLMTKYEKTLRVETLTGRARRGPLTKNQILNHPIQGTAADIVTDAMCELSELAFLEGDDELQPNLNVHDDLTMMLDDTTVMQKIERIAHVMCKPRFDFINVPIIVEAQLGTRWDNLKEVAVYRSNEMFNTPNPYAKETA